MIAEMNGMLWQQKVGAFCCTPYFACKSIELLGNVLEWLEVSEEGLQKILSAGNVDHKWTREDDLTFGNMKLGDSNEQSDSEDN